MNQIPFFNRGFQRRKDQNWTHTLLMRDTDLRSAFFVALCARDYPAARTLGMLMLRDANPSLAQAVEVMRAASLAGDLNSFSKAYRVASALATAIREDDRAFAKSWISLLKFDLQTEPVPRALSTVLRARESGYLLSQNEKLNLTPILEYLSEHEGTFAGTRHLVSSAAAGRRIQTPATFHLYGSLWLLIPRMASQDARRIWTAVTSQALRHAAARRIDTAMIPDYLVPCARNAPYALSFHTRGLRPGLTHFKPADLPGYAVIDRGGYSGWSSMARAQLNEIQLPTPTEATAYYDFHFRKVVDLNVSKYPQPDTAQSAPLPDHFVFVPLQMRQDSTQELARIPMMNMLRLVVERFRGTETKVVVKRHPMCKDAAISAELQQLSRDHAIVLRNDSIHTLISGSRAVFTVNSGVGSEAMVHLKPIYLFGEADYACAAHRVENGRQFHRLTASLYPALGETEMKQFLCYYRTRYLVQIDDQKRLGTAIAERLFREQPRSMQSAIN